MATEHNSDDTPQVAGKRKELPPAVQKRLMKCFEHANKMVTQENYDYAVDLLTTCVVGDPSNAQYAASFFNCLRKKYNNNKKGDSLAFIKGASLRRAVGKAEASEDWEGVIKAGVEVLKLNPWDVPTLVKMSEACKAMGYDELEFAYLKAALDANPNDIDICRKCALALEERKLFDQAIAVWHRIEQIRPGDEEAARAVGRLTVEKTIAKGGYEDADPNRKKVAQGDAAASDLSPIEKLEREIKRKPNEVPKYLELAALYLEKGNHAKAEEVLSRAYEISNHDVDIREKLEDVQLNHLRIQQGVAEKAVKESGSEEAKRQLEELNKKIYSKDLDILKNRCERYPNNLGFKYDLGIKYYQGGLYREAIVEFQQARNDPRRKGYAALALGQCFQQIKQIPLAMTHYDAAIEEIPERDIEHRNRAQYLAAVLAFQQKDLDLAERHATQVAARNFAYKGIADLLDKIRKARENQSPPDESRD